ncbi:hypothetical protein B0H14DRAFT_2654633 [Mycena olivaceomarginata]|nr:hypothetical protein B0H14DRAFT_2654633 [Mycena olivaceomarginata]
MSNFFLSDHYFFIQENNGLEESWRQQYGRTFRVQLRFIHPTDPKAIHHFLSNTRIYPKSEPSRFSLGKIVGLARSRLPVSAYTPTVRQCRKRAQTSEVAGTI